MADDGESPPQLGSLDEAQAAAPLTQSGGEAAAPPTQSGGEVAAAEEPAAAPPQPVDPLAPSSIGHLSEGVQAFLRKASKEQQFRARGVEVQRSVPLDHGALLCISAGSVTDFAGGTDWPPGACAAVNAANNGGLYGGGVDGAFCRAGGPVLAQDREAMPVLNNTYDDRIKTGSAEATGPNRYGQLHVGTVIHAVGPIYGYDGGFKEADRDLKSAYKTTMDIAKARGIQYLGVCLLSAGIFRGGRSLEAVLDIAVSSVAANAYPGLKEVHLVGFTPPEIRILTAHAESLEKRLHGRES